MIYQDEAARITAKKWKTPRSTVRRWERSGILPDYRVFGEPLSKADLLTEEKLIRLVESGWLKARPISRLMGSEDRVNALMTARRYPDDPRYHVRQLKAAEIRKIKPVLEGLQRSIGTLLYVASLTPAGQNYGEVVQADLRALLRREYINGAAARDGMYPRQVNRVWAFLRGQMANRKDLDAILLRLKALLELLS